ncbi:hypothetical protein MP228_001235 [Amoeboaphelidium protococcarum]|nr:hypothetical protein MP228_001235 [Amoeboaphelidium protococcarum]
MDDLFSDDTPAMKRGMVMSDEVAAARDMPAMKKTRVSSKDDNYDDALNALEDDVASQNGGGNDDDDASDGEYDISAEELSQQQQQTQAYTQQREERRRRMKDVDGAAEVGIFENLQIVNFMCHKFLEINFGPRINFIVGLNGSGKSAVLTSIMVCLGGKANVTNRASNLKDLIRTGEQQAEIRLRIKNEGVDAYKPELFGERITIVRTLVRGHGTSAYKLLSQTGKVVSTLKSELNNMLDHMTIQPDNPLLILHQDAARHFLQSSTEADRYNLFMQGTQLLQLHEDYQKVRQSFKGLEDYVVVQKALLPDLRTDASQAHKRLKQLEAAMTLDERIQRAKKEAFWCTVYEIEDKVRQLQEKVDLREAKIPDAQLEVMTHEKQINELTERVRELNNAAEVYKQASDPLLEKKNELKQYKAQVTNESKNLVNQELEMNSELQRLKTHKAQFDKQIAEERLRTSPEQIAEQRAKKEADIQSVQQQLQEKDIEIDQLQTELTDLNSGNYQEQLDDKIRNATNQLKIIENDKHQLQYQIRNMELNLGNPLAVYGPELLPMLQEIQKLSQQGRFRSMPVGPIGAHIQLTDNTFVAPINAHIGVNAPFAFIVGSSEDSKLLKKVFTQYKYGIKDMFGNIRFPHDVYVAQYDPQFDCSIGMPARDGRYSTILDVMQIDNPLVLQLLVNIFGIEQVILVKERKVGEALMSRQWPKNVSNCYDAAANKIGHRGGGSVNMNMGGKTQSLDSGFGMLCTGRQNAAMLERYQQRLAYVDETINVYHKNLSEFRQQINEIDARRRQLEYNVNNARAQRQRLVDTLAQMNEDLEEFNLAALNDAVLNLEKDLKGIEEQIDTLKSQFPHLLIAREDNRKKGDQVDQQIGQLDVELQELHTKFQSEKEVLEEEARALGRLKFNQAHYTAQLQKYNAELQEAREELQKGQDNYDTAVTMAREFCDLIERVDLEHSTSERYRRHIESLQKQLEKKEADQGSLDEAVENFRIKQSALENVEQEIELNNQLIQKLRHAYITRMASLKKFKENIAVRAGQAFCWLLRHRQYVGYLKFDHEKKRLIVHVETGGKGDQQETTATQVEENRKAARRKKDPKSLSGGEKSFATVCLLLALWEAMGCTIRALDEFDVFMDTVNRKLSMDLLIGTARDSLRTQYILITPQSMGSNVVTGPDIKVIRMEDPERRWQGGQQVLDRYMPQNGQ